MILTKLIRRFGFGNIEVVNGIVEIKQCHSEKNSNAKNIRVFYDKETDLYKTIFESYKKISLSPFFARLARCGVEIYLNKIGAKLDVGEYVRLYDGDAFFALGEVREFEAGAAIKPIKQFDV